MSPLHPYNVEMSKEELQIRVGLLEERIGCLERLVVDLSGAVDLLHGSAVLAGEIMEGTLDKLDILEEANAKV